MKTSSRWSKVARVWLSFLLGMIMLLGVGSSPALAVDPRAGVFGGDAYGTFANATAGPVAAQLGRSGWIFCPCQGTNGVVRSNTVHAVNVGTILTARNIYNTAFGNKTATLAETQQTSKIEQLSLLDGLISATAMEVVATTQANATTIESSAGASFTDLKIGNQTIASTVAPNTDITLTGIGRVRVNEVIRTGNRTSSGGITINMLHIFVTQSNTLGLRVGSEIVVAHAASRYTRSPLQGITRGTAFVARDVANVGPASNRIGTMALVGIGCTGTGGRTIENNVAAMAVGNILSWGPGRTTAFGGNTSEGTVAQTTATVHQVNLLNGLVQADALTAVAKSVKNEGIFSASTEGSEFVNLRVLGIVQPNVAPNTRINLPNIGYVILYQRFVGTTSSAPANVNMIRVVITTSNSFGLPVGTQLFVGKAYSAVNPF